jgi:hypothetical protein
MNDNWQRNREGRELEPKSINESQFSMSKKIQYQNNNKRGLIS